MAEHITSKGINKLVSKLRAELDEDCKEDWKIHVCKLFTKWLTRGDGVAVYANHAMDSANLGHKKFISYGSATSQIETPEPPQTLPDIGGEINWAYQLERTYKLS